MLRFKGSSVAVLSVILLAGFGGGAALAGEITGSGKWIAGSETAPLQGKSDCAFSGLNDNSVLGNPLPDGDGFTRSQSFGQIVRQHSPDAPPPGTPGTACNPTKSSGGE